MPSPDSSTTCSSRPIQRTLQVLVGTLLLVIVVLYMVSICVQRKWKTCKDVLSLVDTRVATDTVVIITGASSGIGEHAARKLDHMGASVVYGCRNTAKARPVSDRGCVLELHLNQRNSIESFAKNYACAATTRGWRNKRRIVVVCNAGAFASTNRAYPSNGLNETFVTNHLGHFHLVQLLRNEIDQHVESRIIFVSSGSLIDSIPQCKKYEPSDYVHRHAFGFAPSVLEAYNASKLFNYLTAQQLQIEMPCTEVCTVLPGGLIPTNIADKWGKVVRFLYQNIVGKFTMTVDQGASTTLFCTLTNAPVLNGVFENSEQRQIPIDPGLQRQLQAELWGVSQHLALIF